MAVTRKFLKITDIEKEKNDQMYDSSSLQRNVCKKIGHASEKCRYKYTTRNKLNHMDKECCYKKKEEFFSKSDTKDPMFYTCFDAHKESNDIWHLGNGCSNHITGNRDCFVNLDEKVSSQ